MYQSSAASTILDLHPIPHTSFDPTVSAHSQSGGWPRPPLEQYTLAHEYGERRRAEFERPRQAKAALHAPSTFSHPNSKDAPPTPPMDTMSTTTHAHPHTFHNDYDSRQADPYRATIDSQTLPLVLPYPVRHSTSQIKDPASDLRETQNHLSTRKSPKIESTKTRSNLPPNLQIPASINKSGGSLGEFAAQITCLFWFESTSTLRRAESLSATSSPVKRLVPDAVPTLSFRKWVVTILSTTQVTPNVILLALLFIYRLKTLNPTVKGRAGSEYRLLTVALMLGNKFLDDNTYTNKTWAEVSGIAVSEIHIMEVEFLSNMRYSLLASTEQWEEWQMKLGKFSEYFELASTVPFNLPSPSGLNAPLILPSPPSSLQTSPPLTTTSALGPTLYAQQQQQHHWPGPYGQASMPASLPSVPDLVPGLPVTGRKRSRDGSVDEPLAKRAPYMTDVHHPRLSQQVPTLPRLPVPNLALSTSQSALTSHMGYAHHAPLLPPPQGRAMSLVFPTTPTWTPHAEDMITPTGQSNVPHQIMNGSHFGTPSRRHSPTHRSVQDVLSVHSSPASGMFPSVSSQGSPSFFLQQRASPYRPVRPPNTLLHAPPTGSIQTFPPSVDQMHYQPLGRRNDYRTGVVPDYVPHPQYQHWPVLPQPNFYN